MYWLRVVVISFEFLIVIISVFLINVYGEMLNPLIKEIQINDEVLKWLMLLPAGLLGWSFVQTQSLLFPDGEFAKILHMWPSYSKLKIHCVVGLIYAVLFLIIGLFPLFIKDSLNTAAGFIMLFCGVAGESVVALSIYSAQISVKEIAMRAGS